MNKVISGLQKGGVSTPPYRGPQDRLLEMLGCTSVTGLKPHPSGVRRSTFHQAAKAGVTRRDFLRTLTAAAGTVAAPSIIGGGAAKAQEAAGTISTSKLKDGNPRWYGFNLLEYFSTDLDWMKYFPYKNDGMFLEDDFRWMRDWGFNFVRLPMAYRFWTDPNDLMKIDEKKVEPIDRAIRLGEKYGVHVNICLHRAAGFCVLDGLDAVVTGIHVTPEKASFYKDLHA